MQRLPNTLATVPYGAPGVFGANVAWLIDPSPFVARFERHKIALSNGLIRRVLRLLFNATADALAKLTTGPNVLRGVKPEAIVEMDGIRFQVGGLRG
jgi:hypothetical protein